MSTTRLTQLQIHLTSPDSQKICPHYCIPSKQDQIPSNPFDAPGWRSFVIGWWRCYGVYHKNYGSVGAPRFNTQD